MKRVITILADGFEETEAVTFIDLLRRARIDVSVLGVASKVIRGSHDIRIEADELLENYSGIHDAIVLPGGMPGTTNLASSERVRSLVADTFQRGMLCAAICAAPMVLGKAGILQGIRTACYPGFENQLGGAIAVNEPVVRDHNVITSRGVGTAIPFSLELISYLTDQEISGKVRSAILWD